MPFFRPFSAYITAFAVLVFGWVSCIAIETGQAFKAVGEILKCENINLCGFHCHIGSQIFESSPFMTAADIMFDFIAEMQNKYGIEWLFCAKKDTGKRIIELLM